MKACSLFPTLILFLLVRSAVAATVINVPADQPTIQAAINAASNGDIVLVSPGTYTENINFLGKAITVKSSSGPSVTTITSDAQGSIVSFTTGEGTASVLQGFSIEGGILTTGIYISSSPAILNNKIKGNHGCDGPGIFVSGGSHSGKRHIGQLPRSMQWRPRRGRNSDSGTGICTDYW